MAIYYIYIYSLHVATHVCIYIYNFLTELHFCIHLYLCNCVYTKVPYQGSTCYDQCEGTTYVFCLSFFKIIFIIIMQNTVVPLL